MELEGVRSLRELSVGHAELEVPWEWDSYGKQAPRSKDRSSKTGQNGTCRSELGGDHAGVLLKSPLQRTCYKKCS